MTYSNPDDVLIEIPAEFRKLLGDKVFVSRHRDQQLFIFTPEGLNEVNKTIEFLDPNSHKGFIKFIASGITERTVNDKGQVEIPAYIMDFLPLDGVLVFTPDQGGVRLSRTPFL